MFVGLFLLCVFLLSAASAHHTVLIADNEGIHIVDPPSQNRKTVLRYAKGSNSVLYNLENGYTYGIFESQNDMEYRILRTKVLEQHDSSTCQKIKLPDWCNRNPFCVNICESENPYIPLNTKLYGCSRASNLITDWVNNNLYWTCDPKTAKRLDASVNMADIEGRNNMTIFTRPNQIQSIGVDPFLRKLFVLESNKLIETTLRGDNASLIYKFDSPGEKMSKISLDTQNRIIYIVGQLLKDNKERFLASVNYDGSGYRKLYTSDDPAWQAGPKVVNGVVYWLTTSNDSEWRSVGGGEVQMKKLTVPYEAKQWSLVHVDAYKPLNGSHCYKMGCSHTCTISPWMQVVCQCPAEMILSADNKTCNEGVNPLPKVTTQESVEEKTLNGSQEVIKSVLNGSHDAAGPVANGTAYLPESAVETSQNATTGAVTASSSSMALFYVVVSTILLSIFIVAVIVKRRAKIGNYQPAGTGERRAFSL